MTSALAAVRRWPQMPVVTMVAAMAVIATAGLHGVFETWDFLLPAVVGSAGAMAVAVAAGRWRLLAGEAVAASVIGFVILGVLTCGVTQPRAFFTGLTGGWADVLSGAPPVELTGSLRAVPFALAWIGVLLGAEIARHTRLPAIPAVGPLLTLTITALVAVPGRSVALAQGAAIAAGTLGIALVQQRVPRTGTGVGAASRRLRPIGRAAVMIIAVAVAAPFVGPHLPLADAHDRYDLRDQVVPPWDPLAVPSPLVQVKASLKEGRVGDVVFTVQADTPIARWQVAVLGAYDGVVWTVGSGSGDAADEFRPVGTRLPDPPDGSVADEAATVSATVTIADLGGPWLPSPGWATRVSIDGSNAPELRENLQTGTLALTSGAAPGTVYQIEAATPATPSDEQLVGSQIGLTSPSADLDVLPPAVRNIAADIVEGVDTGWPQVVAVRDAFRSTGFYDSTEGVPPGHSYFRLAEFLADPERIVGYEEQYAAAAAVITRIARLPSRVVVGYLVPPDRYVGGTAEVRAGDISAWIEVQVDGAGWVPVDVTPDRSRVPTVDQQGPSFEDIAIPNPPPPPQPPPDLQVVTDDQEEPPADEDDDHEDDAADAAAGGLGWQGWAATGAGGAGGLVLLFAGVVVGWKVRRARRRRSRGAAAARIAGAWDELADRYRDARVPTPLAATPLEAARGYLQAEPTAEAVRAELLGLVATVDRAGYHPADPDDGEAVQAWRYCDAVVGALDVGRSRWQRILMRLDPRSLRPRHRGRRSVTAQSGVPA